MRRVDLFTIFHGVRCPACANRSLARFGLTSRAANRHARPGRVRQPAFAALRTMRFSRAVIIKNKIFPPIALLHTQDFGERHVPQACVLGLCLQDLGANRVVRPPCFVVAIKKAPVFFVQIDQGHAPPGTGRWQRPTSVRWCVGHVVQDHAADDGVVAPRRASAKMSPWCGVMLAKPVSQHLQHGARHVQRRDLLHQGAI